MTRSYKVLSPVKHGGRIHEVGSTIDLDDETAAPLIASGVIQTIQAIEQDEAARNAALAQGRAALGEGRLEEEIASEKEADKQADKAVTAEAPQPEKPATGKAKGKK